MQSDSYLYFWKCDRDEETLSTERMCMYESMFVFVKVHTCAACVGLNVCVCVCVCECIVVKDASAYESSKCDFFLACEIVCEHLN